MMTIHKATLSIMLVLSLASGPAGALKRGDSADGRPFVSGGVGEGEIRTLEAELDNYSLWVITAARKSGAYLAAVPVRITAKNDRLIFEGTLEGPWLLIDLPPGQFSVEAKYKDQAQRKTTSIQEGDHHQMIFYFDAPDIVPATAAGK